ncbi:ankyrin repeat protein, partial [Polyplosphaeria fusca]
TPLHYAAGLGQKKAVNWLLDRGVDAAAKDHHGNMPLHLAAVTGQLGIFKLLVDSGVDVNAETRFGWAAIDLASMSHHTAAVAELMLLGS